MEKTLLTCLVCPLGCRMEAQKVSLPETEYFVTGYKCPKGEIYALHELTNPTRILTTTIKIKNAISPRFPVRTVTPIPKHLIRKCIDFLNGMEIEAPVQMGEKVIQDILGTGVDVIASRSIKIQGDVLTYSEK